VADHLFKAIQQMADNMGITPDAVVNQALFTFARLNGYVVPSSLASSPVAKEAVRTQSSDMLPQSAETLQADDSVEEMDASESLLGNSLFDEPASIPSELGLRSQLTPAATEIDPAPNKTLYLSHKGAHPVEVTGDRFVLGRGKHCQFVIDSTRVSREHAAIVREGNELFIEDLKSSNGTWFEKNRIAKRRISDGDEFMLGSEPVKCTYKVSRKS
jgi:hypothetical protein